jgi:hypothetical protein
MASATLAACWLMRCLTISLMAVITVRSTSGGGSSWDKAALQPERGRIVFAFVL